MSKPELLRVHLRFSLTSEAGIVQYTYSLLSSDIKKTLLIFASILTALMLIDYMKKCA